MSSKKPLAPIAIAVAAGLMLWFVTSLITGKREPWDVPVYWVVVYPIAIFFCALLGYAYPERPWRWVLVLFETQFLVMCVRNGELGGLWPLGMVLFGIIALPGVLAAKLASRYGARSVEGGA